MGEDETFFYFAIDLVDTDQNGDLPEYYGYEMDFEHDFRGDYFLEVQNPSDDKHKAGWTQKDLALWYDKDNDVGGNLPTTAGEGTLFTGYENEYWKGEDSESPSTDNAWVRISPEDSTVVEFALKKSYIGNPMPASLRGWAMKGAKDHNEFYFHDQYSESDAGSPYSSNSHFPSGDIYEIDNTKVEARPPFVVPEVPYGTLMALFAIFLAYSLFARGAR